MLIKPPAPRDPATRITISLKSSTLRLIETYGRYVEAQTGIAPDRSHLIEQMVLSVCDRDTAFKKATSSQGNAGEQ